MTDQSQLNQTDRIVSIAEAASIRGVSVDTLKRQLKRGEGPELLRVSARRIGFRLSDVLNPPKA